MSFQLFYTWSIQFKRPKLQIHSMTPTRQEIIAVCQALLDEKSATLMASYKWLSDSANVEQKSTAGDKHDTAKAMVHLEQEKLGQQLALLNQQKQLLNQIKSKTFNSTQAKIELGSILHTQNGLLFISTYLPSFTCQGISVQPISLQSPLIQSFVKQFPKPVIVFQGKTYEWTHIE